ncbi:MAG: choice-of-anchor D domain-containing protein [Kaistella sp.]
MKTILLLLRNGIFSICFMLVSGISFGQTLIGYPLTDNLNTNVGPIDITNPTIGYYDPPNIDPPIFFLNHLLFQNNLDEVRFSFNAPALYSDGIILQFHTTIAGLGFGSISGNIKVFMQVDNLPETLIDEETLNANVFIAGRKTYDFSTPLTGLNVNSQVKIRIVGSRTLSGTTLNFFGINNLKLIKDVTSISVRSTKIPQPPLINHNDAASVIIDTDFGSLLTNDIITADKTYTITNTGPRALKISSISMEPNDAGFSIIGAFPATVLAGQSANFMVRFAPTNQGLKNAEVVIAGNIVPNNPFRFEVMGNGKSCNLEPIPILFQNFETSGSNLNTALISGAPGATGNTSNSPTPAITGVVSLYPTNTNLYSSGSSSQSLFVRGNSAADTNGVAGTGEVTLEFGPIDITAQQEVSVNFDVAAFSASNSSSGSNNTGSGVNGYDYVMLQVLKKDGITWSDEIRLNGSGTSASNEFANRSYKYGFGTTLVPESDFDGTLYSVTNANTTKYSKFKLNIPVSELTSNFTFRIKARSGRTRTGTSNFNYKYFNHNIWLIDNVHVDAGNANVKSWAGTSWADSRPSPRDKAKFTGNYDFSAAENVDLKICGCEVADGVNFTIPGGRTLEVQNSIINNGDGSNFVVESDANLIQIESGAGNTGNITVERSVTDMDNIPSKMDYVYWSSPVANQNLHAFSPGTPAANFLQYKEATDYFVTTYDGVFHPAKGYAIRAETSGVSSPSYVKTYQFVGVPNNGDYPITITRSQNTGTVPNVAVHGYNLVGNPYPSNIDFDKLYDGNSAKIFKTAWFWTNDSDNPAQQGSEYDGTNYVVYNGTGGSTPAANGIIKVGQGFLIQNKGSENSSTFLNFQNSYGKNNVLRVNTPGRFYQKESSPKNRFWLKLISPDNMVNTQLIGYIDGATDGFEQDYDAEIMGMSSDIFYSKLDDKRLLIQGKGDFQTTDKVELGANFFKAGTYTLALETAEGIFNGSQKIYLRDKETGTLTDLSANPYTFEATKGISEGRFEIIYEPQQVVLGAEETLGENIIVYRDGGDFIIRAQSKNITDLEVYDGSGRLIYKIQPRYIEVRLPGEKLLRGVYILKIDQNGHLSKKKILK